MKKRLQWHLCSADSIAKYIKACLYNGNNLHCSSRRTHRDHSCHQKKKGSHGMDLRVGQWPMLIIIDNLGRKWVRLMKHDISRIITNHCSGIHTIHLFCHRYLVYHNGLFTLQRFHKKKTRANYTIKSRIYLFSN